MCVRARARALACVHARACVRACLRCLRAPGCRGTRGGSSRGVPGAAARGGGTTPIRRPGVCASPQQRVRTRYRAQARTLRPRLGYQRNGLGYRRKPVSTTLEPWIPVAAKRGAAARRSGCPPPTAQVTRKGPYCAPSSSRRRTRRGRVRRAAPPPRVVHSASLPQRQRQGRDRSRKAATVPVRPRPFA